MVNKTRFYTGLFIVVVAAILLLGNFLGDSTFPIFLGILGIIVMGASKYRPLEGKKS